VQVITLLEKNEIGTEICDGIKFCPKLIKWGRNLRRVSVTSILLKLYLSGWDGICILSLYWDGLNFQSQACDGILISVSS
jgi:hypothetical protein